MKAIKGIGGVAIDDATERHGKYEKDFTARATIGEVVQIADKAAKHYANDAKWLAIAALSIAIATLAGVIITFVARS